MNPRKVAEQCMNLSFFQLQDFAGKNYNKVYEYIEARDPGNANKLLIPTIFTCIASNGRLSDREWDFIKQFIGGYTYDEALDTAGEFYHEDAQNIVRELVACFPMDIKEAYLSLCIAVLAVDERFDGAEVDFLNSLLG